MRSVIKSCSEQSGRSSSFSSNFSIAIATSESTANSLFSDMSIEKFSVSLSPTKYSTNSSMAYSACSSTHSGGATVFKMSFISDSLSSTSWGRTVISPIADLITGLTNSE